MGKYRCPGCDDTYDEQQGDTHEGYPPGTLFASLPEEFTCPDCAVRDKPDFIPLGSGEVEEKAGPRSSPGAER